MTARPPSPGRIRPARPTIRVGGQDRPALARGLTGLLVAETAAGLYRCEATVSNWGAKGDRLDFLYFDRAVLDFGADFVVAVGQTTVFAGRITGLEAVYPAGREPLLTVLAEDRLQDLRMTRRTRTFADRSDADVVRQVATDHGLQADVRLTGGPHPVLAQVNQSDLAFLRDRGRAAGFEVWVDGDKLIAAPRPDRGGERVRLTYGADLREFTALADLAHQRTKVTVGGWDAVAGEAVKGEADDGLLSGELDGTTSGSSILQEKFGARADGLTHAAPATAGEARARAEAWFRATARRFVTGRGVADADGRVRVGVTVELAGLGPLFSGAYAVTEARHLFDEVRGFRTEFAAERPGLGKP